MLVDRSCENWFWKPNLAPMPTFDLALLSASFPSPHCFPSSSPSPDMWENCPWMKQWPSAVPCTDLHFKKNVRLSLRDLSSQMGYIFLLNTITCVLYSLHGSRRILVCRNCTLNRTVSLLSHGRMICCFRIGWGGRESKCSATNS